MCGLALLSDRLLLSAGADATLRVWNLDTMKQLAVRGQQRGPMGVKRGDKRGWRAGRRAGPLRVWALDPGRGTALMVHGTLCCSPWAPWSCATPRPLPYHPSRPG